MLFFIQQAIGLQKEELLRDRTRVEGSKTHFSTADAKAGAQSQNIAIFEWYVKILRENCFVSAETPATMPSTRQFGYQKEAT
ncbi:MAG: hypothetical protein WBQ36_14295 [Desulfobaccales bacterium]